MADELLNDGQVNIGDGTELPIEPVEPIDPVLPPTSLTALKEEIKNAVIAELKAASLDIRNLEVADTLKGFTSLPAMQGTAMKLVPLSLLTALTDEEYIKRLQGISEQSNAFLDPFMVLPGGVDGKGGFSTVEGCINSLDLLVPGTDGINAYKTCGYFRGALGGVPVIVYNFQRSYANKELTQVVIGTFRLNDDGNVEWAPDYGILKRTHKADSWGAWDELVIPTAKELRAIKAALPAETTNVETDALAAGGENSTGEENADEQSQEEQVNTDVNV